MPPRRLRLDQELVRRGLARSREHASELVAAGRVTVSGAPARKPATGVTTDVAIVVREDVDRPDYVSRGGHKLAGALDAFATLGLTVDGRRCLDAGASTGGFTDVLLRRGASRVLAVDVGYGQLAWSLQSDERVVVHDRTNIRELDLEVVGDPVEVVVGDLSFISLSLVLDALIGVTRPDGDLASARAVWCASCRCAPRRSSRWPTRLPCAAGVPWLRRRARCPGRRATSSSSSGSAVARRPSPPTRSTHW